MITNLIKFNIKIGAVPLSNIPLQNIDIRIFKFFGLRSVYFGELDGSGIGAKGRGVKVIDDGEIQIGEWDDDVQNGYGRCINSKGK
jgi:hypothetical protein